MTSAWATAPDTGSATTGTAVGSARGAGVDPARLELGLAAVRDRDRGGDEAVEQRMRPLGPALELGMELAGHEPRVVLQLDDLDEPPVGRLAGQEHAGRLERLAVAVVHLEAMAMALVDDLLAVDRRRLGAGGQLGRVEAEAHRAALVLHVALVRHEVDDRVLGEHVELGRVRVRRADDLAGELDDRALQPEAQAEIRDAVVAGVVGGEDLALDAAMAEAAGRRGRRRPRRVGRAGSPWSAPRNRPNGSSRRRRAPTPRGAAPR